MRHSISRILQINLESGDVISKILAVMVRGHGLRLAVVSHLGRGGHGSRGRGRAAHGPGPRRTPGLGVAACRAGAGAGAARILQIPGKTYTNVENKKTKRLYSYRVLTDEWNPLVPPRATE
eukprot:3179809-Prymnesium_polylepis.1